MAFWKSEEFYRFWTISRRASSLIVA
jgi:hypothetical protein